MSALELRPGSAAGSAAYRLLMAATARAPSLASDPSGRRIATALRATAHGRGAPEERAWAARIEEARRRIPALAATGGGPAPAPERLDEASRACAWMSLPPVLCRFLLRAVRELRPSSCLELGTGFGISTAYQAAALALNGSGSIVTLDIESMGAVAAPVLEELGLAGQVGLVGGFIDDNLDVALDRAAPIDFAFLDADHTEEATVAHFEALVPALAAEAVVVVDDIAWTAEMRRAWARIRSHGGVATSVSLRRLGIVVVRGPGRDSSSGAPR